jgi:DNA processing protein
MAHHDERLTLLALCAIDGANWHVIARAAAHPDGIAALLAGEPLEHSTEATSTASLVVMARDQIAEHVDRARREIETAQQRAGARLVTVLDDDYPANLRPIFNLPPFLFVRGELRRDDVRSVAVVGTRDATDDGLQRARQMSRELVAEGVTVLSGLAKGIDTAAHTEALERGGRTVAVIGTGILRTYPSENKALAEEIARRGAIVSQFWPSQPPAKYTFPRRNVVTSGMGQGTVVIEASSTSGAKLQARLAVQHGKLVFLVDSLVTDQPWAEKMLAESRRAIRISRPGEVIERLRAPEDVEEVARARQQLQLSLG